MERDLTWGGEHTIPCTDDMLWNCAPEPCTTLLTSATPINSIKREKRDNTTPPIFLKTLKIKQYCDKKISTPQWINMYLVSIYYSMSNNLGTVG